MGATSGSTYSGDKETHHIVFGWELYFMGALIAHKSKACRSVTLSSTEAGYYALSKVTKEVIFAKQVIETMGIGLNLPIKIKVDNIGVFYLAKNYFVGEHQEKEQSMQHLLDQKITKQTSSQRIHQKRYSCVNANSCKRSEQSSEQQDGC
jgi:hypothetical protein